MLGFGMALCSGASRALTVTACAEPNKGPPWLYPVVGPDGKPTGELAVFTADVVRNAFASFNVEVHQRGDLPLICCLAMVASHYIDFAVGPYYDTKRARVLAYSTPYRVLTPQIFYDARRPINVSNIDDLAKYRGCGRHGWSYSHYGIKPGTLDTGASTYAADSKTEDRPL